MPQYFPRLFTGQPADEFPQKNGFWCDRELALFNSSDGDAKQTLAALVFKVTRNPKDLLAHLRRIYFCFDQHLPDPLYAALLDLVIVLQGKGTLISRRMIQASRSRLSSRQFHTLHNTSGQELPGNRYSVFSSGVLGSRELVRSGAQTEIEYDYLTLANDFIEYSQLEQAMDVLETGIALHPDRPDLQQSLLELYKSTASRERFQNHRQSFSESGVALVNEWLLLAHYFEGQGL